jgi:hypothetical protein
VFAGWLVAQGIRSPAYEVLAREEGYEVRRYGPLLAAQVTVDAPWSEAFRKGTALLSEYLDSDNTVQESVALARPGAVAQGEEIAGAAPVLMTLRDTTWLVSALMPPERTDVGSGCGGYGVLRERDARPRHASGGAPTGLADPRRSDYPGTGDRGAIPSVLGAAVHSEK